MVLVVFRVIFVSFGALEGVVTDFSFSNFCQLRSLLRAGRGTLLHWLSSL